MSNLASTVSQYHPRVSVSRTSWAKAQPQTLKFPPKQLRRLRGLRANSIGFWLNESNSDFAKVEWWCLWVCLPNITVIFLIFFGGSVILTLPWKSLGSYRISLHFVAISCRKVQESADGAEAPWAETMEAEVGSWRICFVFGVGLLDQWLSDFV